jgi:nucleotide-binding universal stress UspA family protein
MISTMLVPLDGSAAAEAALGYAALIPSQRVSLVRVEPGSDAMRLTGMPEKQEWQAEVEAEAESYLERRADRLRRQGREVDTAVLRGDPAEQILANAGDADLIVMTTHGRGAGSRALFGSVADRVAHHAKSPTLVVRTGDRAEGPPQITRIVVPLDGSPLGDQALEPATELAALLGVPVHLVRVVDGDAVRGTVQAGLEAGAAYARTRDAARHQAEADLEAKARTPRAQTVNTTTEVRAGNPVTELLDVIKPTDLVVMTTHGRGGIQRWLMGSVADKLVRQASAPVMIVRPHPPNA